MTEQGESVRESGPFNQLVLQSIMAFGQGAGSMSASGPALDAAVGAYADQMKLKTVQESYSVFIIEFARAVGQVAATHAATQRRCVIDVPDVKFALSVVRRNTLAPLQRCPITAFKTRHS